MYADQKYLSDYDLLRNALAALNDIDLRRYRGISKQETKHYMIEARVAVAGAIAELSAIPEMNLTEQQAEKVLDPAGAL